MSENQKPGQQPPLSNKGGNTLPSSNGDKKITARLDWLRYTAKWQSNLSEADNLRVALPRYACFALTGEMQANSRGYNRAMKLTIGVIHWHTELPSQGVSVELSGSALEEARGHGVTDEDILRHIDAIGANVSTMDGALDVRGYGARPTDIIEARDSGTLTASARAVGQYTSSTLIHGEWQRADTVYVGSPKSDFQLRIYDKGKEQGTGEDWTRLEVRWRDKRARAAHKAMMADGVAATIRAALKSSISIEAQWWKDALAGELATIEPIGRPDSATVKWLLTAALPALERELRRGDGADTKALYDKFAEVLDTYNRGQK